MQRNANIHILKEYIHTLIKNQKYLNEVSKSINDLGINFHLIKVDAHDATNLILLNSKNFKRAVMIKNKKIKSTMPSIESIVYGFISFGIPVEGEAYGASQVYYSSASKGYGPLMYDLALSYANKLISDRGGIGHSTSKSAEKVWKYYFYNRKDVKHYKLDDIENPKTPPTFDDSIVYSSNDDENVLNYAYELTNKIDVQSAIVEGDVYLLELSEELDLDIEYLKKYIDDLSKSHFRMNYNE